MMRGIIVTEHGLSRTNILVTVEELDRMVAFNGNYLSELQSRTIIKGNRAVYSAEHGISLVKFYIH
jgi:hypothetical protein